VSPAGAQAEHTRYSLVYFARPEDNLVLKRLESGKISSGKFRRRMKTKKSQVEIGFFGAP
jgi:hypothetical protein